MRQAASVMLAAGRLDESARSGVQRADESSNHPRQSTAPAAASSLLAAGSDTRATVCYCSPKSKPPA
jgi:hypothetical protein